jgi:hypothetical protein
MISEWWIEKNMEGDSRILNLKYYPVIPLEGPRKASVMITGLRTRYLPNMSVDLWTTTFGEPYLIPVFFALW